MHLGFWSWWLWVVPFTGYVMIYDDSYIKALGHWQGVRTMTFDDLATLSEIRAYIDGLSHEECVKVREAAEKISDIVAEYGEYGKLAMALLGALMAAE